MPSRLQKIFSPSAQSPNQESSLPLLLTAEYNMKHEHNEPNTEYPGDVKMMLLNNQKKQQPSVQCNLLATLFVIFLICSTVYAFLVWNFHETSQAQLNQVDTLKLISLFNRHGDRAPSDQLPFNDKHAERPHYFWPNGLHNLTDTGKLREYLIGLENRKHYKHFLDFNSSKILAFSSDIYRCRDSLSQFLKGLYEVGSTTSESISFLDNCHDENGKIGQDYCDLPAGSGSASEWTKVHIDYQHIPATALSYNLLKKCNYGIKHRSPVDSDLMSSESIRALKGVEKYRDLVKRRYNQSFNFDALSIWSTVNAEMSLTRTKTTIEFTDHFINWILTEASSSDDNSTIITMFQLAEEVSLLAQRDRVAGLSRRIQLGPIIESLVNSQFVALGYHVNDDDRFQIYEGKNLIIYSSHDSILQLLWFTFNIIETDDASYEERFRKWAKSDNDLVKFLHGLKMSQFGHSARFELWEAKKSNTPKRFPYIQVSMYNKEILNFEKIEYEQIEFGLVCRKFFMKKYPKATKRDLDKFYDLDFVVNTKLSCPFQLFRNLTADLILDRETIHQLCDT